MPLVDPEARKKYEQKYKLKNKEKQREQNKIWRQQNKEKLKDYMSDYVKTDDAIVSRKERRWKEEGINISYKEYMQISKKQNDKCKICDKTEEQIGKSLSVDHCHTTGSIRGLLCYKCNLALGHLEDSVDRLQKAIDYLTDSSISR